MAQRIVAGLDARAGRLATHGWQASTDLDVVTVGRNLRHAGVLRAVYTDIRRDGMLAGADLQGTADLAQRTGLEVIASGGVRDLADIRQLLGLEASGVAGVIVGQALYTGNLDLAAALALSGRVEA
ncbi:MAG: HisA/HisF-related TIM barrel protein [Caldilineales bacterium]